MGGQQVKVTRLLDLKKSAAIKGLSFSTHIGVAYTVNAEDSGKYLVCNNTNNTFIFTLPLANACGGQFWSFILANCVSTNIIGTTANSIFAPAVSLNKGHGVTGIVANMATTSVFGKITIISDGTRYIAWNDAIANVVMREK